MAYQITGPVNPNMTTADFNAVLDQANTAGWYDGYYQGVADSQTSSVSQTGPVQLQPTPTNWTPALMIAGAAALLLLYASALRS